MRRVRLTDALVQGLRPKPREYMIWDKSIGEFGVRVRASGAKSYVLMVLHSGKRWRITLGKVTHMECEAARKTALARLADSTEQSEHASPQFTEFVQNCWVPEGLAQCKASTKRGYLSMLRCVLLPSFGGMKLEAITSEAVYDWFDKYSAKSPGGANHALSLLKSILNFAAARGVLARNPAKGIAKNKRQKLTRFLSQDEATRLYQMMDAFVGAAPTVFVQEARLRGCDIVRFLLLTGCRKGEILSLRKDAMKGDQLHLADSKTGARIIYLSDGARDILARQSTSTSPYVFPSPANPERPLSDIYNIWYQLREKAGLKDVRLHDLRHTFASRAVMEGVPLAAVAKLLGHSKIAMTTRYAHVGDDAAEQAAETLGKRIAELVGL